MKISTARNAGSGKVAPTRLHATLLNIGSGYHALLALVAIALLGVSNIVLEASYVSSGHPASVLGGQTAFRADTIQGYYAAMLEAGTLDIYLRTQLIDFFFIGAVAITGLVVSTLLARLLHRAPRIARLSVLAGGTVMIGAGLDTLENLLSFVMLADPLDFPGFMAPVYSSFAAAKYAAIGLGAAGFAVATAALLPVALLSRRHWSSQL